MHNWGVLCQKQVSRAWIVIASHNTLCDVITYPCPWCLRLAQNYQILGICFCTLQNAGLLFLAATKQLYKWYFPSVCLSVCPSVRPSVTPFSPCSHHCIIMKFSGVITMVKRDVHAKGQGQRSTPVWIHIWLWNHAHSWKQHRRGALLFFKVIRQISRSHGSKNRRIWPRLGVSGL